MMSVQDLTPLFKKGSHLMALMNSMLGMTDEELDKLQLGLGVSGMTPGVGNVADLADAGISAGRGDLLGTILGLGAAIPGLGMAFGAGRGISRAAEQTEAAADIVKPFFSRTARAAENLKRKKPFNDSAHMRKLLKEGGAPLEEMEFLGLQKSLGEGGIGEGRIEPDDLVEHISKNEIRVEEQWQVDLPKEILEDHNQVINELKRRQREMHLEMDSIEDELRVDEFSGMFEPRDPSRMARLRQRLAALQKERNEYANMWSDQNEKMQLLRAKHGPQPEYSGVVAEGPHENYRELKLMWHGNPSERPFRHAGHWEHAPEAGRMGENIFAHVRVSDRYGPNGEKVLFIEEIQSDWHQRGKTFGYRGRKPPPPIKGLKPVRLGDLDRKTRELIHDAMPPAPGMSHSLPSFAGIQVVRDRQRYRAVKANSDLYVLKVDSNSPNWQKASTKFQDDVSYQGAPPRTVITDEGEFLVEDFTSTISRINFGDSVPKSLYGTKPEVLLGDVSKFIRGGKPVPDAPFKEKWAEYAFKRILREASEGDYVHVAWNFGDDMAKFTGGKITGQRHFYDKVLPGIAKKFGKVSDLDIRGLGEGPDKALDELVGAMMSAPQEELSRLVTKYAALTRHSEEEFLEMMLRYDDYGEQTLREVIEEAFQKGWMKTEPRKSLRLSDDTKLSGGIRHHALYKGFPMIVAGGVAASPLISKIADNDPVTAEEV